MPLQKSWGSDSEASIPFRKPTGCIGYQQLFFGMVWRFSSDLRINR